MYRNSINSISHSILQPTLTETHEFVYSFVIGVRRLIFFRMYLRSNKIDKYNCWPRELARKPHHHHSFLGIKLKMCHWRVTRLYSEDALFAYENIAWAALLLPITGTAPALVHMTDIAQLSHMGKLTGLHFCETIRDYGVDILFIFSAVTEEISQNFFLRIEIIMELIVLEYLRICMWTRCVCYIHSNESITLSNTLARSNLELMSYTSICSIMYLYTVTRDVCEWKKCVRTKSQGNACSVQRELCAIQSTGCIHIHVDVHTPVNCSYRKLIHLHQHNIHYEFIV